MFQFFDYILSFIGSILGFMESVVRNAIWLCFCVADIVDFVLRAIAFLPPFFTAFALASVGISLILTIVGLAVGVLQWL